jgi:ABC-type Mn2+/Zn2+ transport system permease subunit
MAGVYVVIFLFGGPILVETIFQTLQTVIGFPVSAIQFSYMILVGYVSYRIFWGTSDDPRHH